MPKRSDTQETVILAIELLRRIPRNRKVTATELHQQMTDLGIHRDLRTIQRQLEMLSAHFDIERDDRNKPYGYKWRQQAAGLNLPMLSEQESLLLTLAEQYLKSLLPAGLMKSMDIFFEQARAKLGPQATAKKEREWLSKVRSVSAGQPLLPPKIKPDVFEAVSNALYGNYWLALDYKNVTGKKTSANVMPLGLVQQGVVLYLVCRYKDYDNERILALHRIAAATVSNISFQYPKDFSLLKYDLDGHFGFGEGKLIRLSFKITKGAGAHLLETRLSEDQQVVEDGDYYQISATVVETARLGWWLRGFGDQVKDIRLQDVDS